MHELCDAAPQLVYLTLNPFTGPELAAETARSLSRRAQPLRLAGRLARRRAARWSGGRVRPTTR